MRRQCLARIRRAGITVSLFGLLLLGGCGTLSQPDLQRLYEQKRELGQPPVVLIHGIMGSLLTDQRTGKEVWYGNLAKLATSRYEEVAYAIDPATLEPMPSTLIPTGLAERAAGRDFYGSILRTLESAGRYARVVPGTAQPRGSRSYYVFLYDWRQDNVKSAAQLGRFIDQIREDHGDPLLKVDIIAHSMGGLITRYFMRYGAEDVLNDNRLQVNLSGADRIRRVILLGTPNLGSAQALHAFIKGRKIGLRSLPTETLASMPSVYQTFPHALNDWLVTSTGKPLDRDLFEIRIWRRFQWSIFDPRERRRIIDQAPSAAEGERQLAVLERYFEKHLERARRFVWSLTVPIPGAHYRLIVFGGDCTLTPARLVVEEVEGISEIRLWPAEITQPVPGMDYDRLMLEPGDGIVTKASLLARQALDPSVIRHRYVNFPLDYSLFLCERHDALTGNITFQDNLLHALLSQDPD
jgi:pimeloyl-ACP methyl ester carboxylesterase